MIEPYWGELLTSPCPLEMSLNYCSHKCAYCFANLNKPDRKADVARISRFIADFRNRKSWAATLMKNQYPIVISNRVDPLAVSNDAIALPLTHQLVEIGCPVAIQTKGGRKEADLLKIVPSPSVFYVSISFTDDAKRKAIEPGAPSVQQRLDFLSRLNELGHDVILGMNPLVMEWLPEPEKLIDAVAERGVSKVWIESLHLNHKQEQNLTDREKTAMGAESIKRAKKRSACPEEAAFTLRTTEYARSKGMEVFSIGQGQRSDVFSGFRRCYESTFPTHQDFVNHCWDELEDGAHIDWSYYRDFFIQKLPSGVHDLGHYIGSTAHTLCREMTWTNWMTFEQILLLAWKYESIKLSPANIECFARAAEDSDDGWVELQDDDGFPWLVFNRGGFSEKWTAI